jgi:hypothetical protein
MPIQMKTDKKTPAAFFIIHPWSSLGTLDSEQILVHLKSYPLPGHYGSWLYPQPIWQISQVM